MGIAFILAKAEKHEHRRDESFADELDAENLLSGLPEKTTHQFRCEASGDNLPKVGVGILLYKTGEKIVAFSFNTQVGIVMSPDASDLCELMEQMGTEACAARVVEVRKTSKIFLVQLES